MFHLFCFLFQVFMAFMFYTYRSHDWFNGFMIGWCTFFALFGLIVFIRKSIKKKSILWFA
jgi:ATP/ADP translocase